jgi:hypothetical protein
MLDHLGAKGRPPPEWVRWLAAAVLVAVFLLAVSLVGAGADGLLLPPLPMILPLSITPGGGRGRPSSTG